VTCPWHGWQFDIDTGRSTFSPRMGVATYEVQIEGNDVLVRLH
jgi:nitrite reductase/ring-hydroxylating ferredoxin subunit